MPNRIQRFFGNGILMVLGLSMLILHPGWAGTEQKKVRVIAENTQVRLKPNVDSIIIKIAPVGAVFESEGLVGDWYRVSFPPDPDGIVVVGYIHLNSVERLRATPIEKQQTKREILGEEHMFKPESRTGFGISFKLSGGWGYSDMSDWNTHLKAKTDLWRAAPVTVEGELKEIHYGPDLSGDVIVQLFQEFGIGLGVGYMETNNGIDKAKMIVKNSTTDSLLRELTDQSKANALSIRLGLYYFFPKNSRFKIFLNAGAGYYFTHLSNIYDDQSWNDYWQQIEFNASSNGIGYHGGLGFELELSRNFMFFIEGASRYAKFSSYTGELTYELSAPSQGSYEGTLYIYESLTNSMDWIPVVNLRRSAPVGALIRNVREAEMNFSGVAVKAGIRIKLW